MSQLVKKILIAVIVLGVALLLYRQLFPPKSSEELYKENPDKFIKENKEKYLSMFKRDAYPLLDSIDLYFQLMMDEYYNQTPPEVIQGRFRQRVMEFRDDLGRIADDYGENYMAAGLRMDDMLVVVKRIDSVMNKVEPFYDMLEAYGVDLDPEPRTEKGVQQK